MKKDSEMHAADDQKKRELVEARNTAEQLEYTARKSLQDNAAAIPEELKKSVGEKAEALAKVKGGEDKEAIRSATETLSRELQKIGELMAKNAQSKQGDKPGEPGNQNNPPGGEARDAEFREGGDEEKPQG